MFDNITSAGISAGLAGLVVSGMFFGKLFSLEEDEEGKSIVIFCLLLALIISTYLCWLAGSTLFLTILPWVWCAGALFVFFSNETDQTDSMFDGFDELGWPEDDELLPIDVPPTLKLVESNPK